jgi:broad specificity phosphatase PhoE
LISELWLVRHGQTDWNLEGRYQGHADIPLNDAGLAQARALADSLAGKPFDAIYSSDLLRAKVTAEIAGETLGIPVLLDERLREIDQGEWEGHLVVDVMARYNFGAAGQGFDPSAVRPPGGESVAEVAGRLASAADDMTSRHPGGKVLVVSHGLAVATLVCHVGQIPLSQVYANIPANARPRVITWVASTRHIQSTINL